jgi:hypothetical protein
MAGQQRPSLSNSSFPPLSSWVRAASPGRRAAVPHPLPAATTSHAGAPHLVAGPWGSDPVSLALRPAWGAEPSAAGGAPTAAGAASALATVADVVPAGTAGLEDPNPRHRQSPRHWLSIRRLLHRSPTRDTLSPRSPLPVRSTLLDRPACGKRPSRGSASARPTMLSLLKLPRRNSTSPRLRLTTAGPPPLTPWAACTASRPHRQSGPGLAPSPRCSGMTRLTRSWLSSTYRLGVSRTFASWFRSSWSHSRHPTRAGGTYFSPFAATPWMTTSSMTPPAWRRLLRGCASTASCSPESWGRSPSTSTASSGTFRTLELLGLPSRASSWATPRPGLSASTQPSAPSSRETSASASTAAR